jgi:hypothetical protein
VRQPASAAVVPARESLTQPPRSSINQRFRIFFPLAAGKGTALTPPFYKIRSRSFFAEKICPLKRRVLNAPHYHASSRQPG